MNDFNEQILEKGYSLTVSEDELQAFIYLTNLMRYEMSITGLDQLLKDEEITSGIDRKMVAEIVTNQRYNSEILIATGKAPQNGADGIFTYHFVRYNNTVPAVLEDGSVDYRDIELFTFVEQGDMLAEYEHATAGSMGFTVRGKLLLPVRGKERPAIRGSGFTLSEDATKYYAKTSGKITYRAEDEQGRVIREGNILHQFMNITPAFVHQGDLLFREGDIEFDGDVLIGGDVQSGVRIYATGDVEINGSVEAADIKAGGSVLVKKGIIGGGKGKIEAEGCIKGKFFESVGLMAKKDIECNYLFNCVVKTDTMVKVRGSKGSIVGGYVYAMMGIEAFTLGNESGVKTSLLVGIDGRLVAAYRQIEKQIEDVTLEINVFQKNNFPETPFYSKIILALELKNKDLKRLREQQSGLQAQITQAVKASVVVRGTVYAGVMIEIENRKLELKQNLKCVNFRKKEDHVAVFRN